MASAFGEPCWLIQQMRTGLAEPPVRDQRHLRDAVGDWSTGPAQRRGEMGGDSTSGALPGPEEPEALGHVQSSEAHGQLSTTPYVPRATTRSSSTPSCRFMSMPRSSYGSMMPGQQVPLER